MGRVLRPMTQETTWTRRRYSFMRMARRFGRILPLLALMGCIPGCSSASSEPELLDLHVRVFVDSDESRTWGGSDVPLADIDVFLDDNLPSPSDSEGSVTFESVSAGRHTIRLESEAVEELASHAVVCGQPAQTIELDDETEVLFCFRAVGFLEVDVSEEDGGE